MSSETLSSSLGGIANFALLSPNFRYEDPYPPSYPTNTNFGPPPQQNPGAPRLGARAGGSQCLESQAGVGEKQLGADEESAAAELKSENGPDQTSGASGTTGSGKPGSSSFLQTLWGYKIWLLVTFFIVMGIVFFMYRKYYSLPQNSNSNSNNKSGLANTQQQQLQQYIQQLQQSLSQQAAQETLRHIR